MAEAPIVVDRLRKIFGERIVLNGVSLSVAQGETVAILGRSGTGKSVLLKTIIGLLDPDGGSVRVLGQDFHTLSERHRLAARKRIGYVFQGNALFDSLTIEENVGFALFQARLPAQEIRKRVAERLEMVGLSETIDQYPSELSGGMQKRVGLARAIINMPEVVLYDEPTTGLDPVTTDVINQIILRLRSRLKVTSVVVTHDIKSAFTIADRLILIDQGLVVAEGTPDEIRSHANAWVQRFIHGQAIDIDRDSHLLPVRLLPRARDAAEQGSSSRRNAVPRDPPPT